MEHGEAGLLNEPGNAGQLGDSVLKLVHDKPLRVYMGTTERELKVAS